MGAVKMTSGLDSRFPMTLERPVHHPLWLLPASAGPPLCCKERRPVLWSQMPAAAGEEIQKKICGAVFKKPVIAKEKKENYYTSSFDASEEEGASAASAAVAI
jgi:hypothetical protein